MFKILAANFDFVPLSELNAYNAFKTRYLLKKIYINIKNTYIYTF